MNDSIILNIPAKADYLMTVRLAASSIGSRMGYDINDIEDIKTATAEACLIIIQVGNSSHIKVEFDIDDNRMKVNVIGVEGESLNAHNTVEDSSLSEYLLEALSDELVINRENELIDSISFCKNLTVK